jgi:hypothetical protein
MSTIFISSSAALTIISEANSIPPERSPRRSKVSFVSPRMPQFTSVMPQWKKRLAMAVSTGVPR